MLDSKSQKILMRRRHINFFMLKLENQLFVLSRDIVFEEPNVDQQSLLPLGSGEKQEKSVETKDS